MDRIHNGDCQGEPAKEGLERDDVIENVCPLCEAERVQKIKDYFDKIKQSWVDWHARHPT
jgi:hypothetical protein